MAVSRSVFAGRAPIVVGDAELPAAKEEPFLETSEPELAEDEDFLEDLVPWMSLDTSRFDHALGEDLEAWSCFPYRDVLVVARLVLAPADGESAHGFAHGRVWQLDEWPPGFDPGTHLGRPEVFASPEPSDSSVEVPEAPAPAMVRPQQVAAEHEVAVRFLGHLYQALVEGYPLIVSVPVAEFRSGGALHALVSLARAGLPTSLKRRCRIRSYTRHPRLFLEQLQCNLVVIPESVIEDALAATPGEAILLDRHGEERISHRGLREGVLGYAQAVVARALRLPAGLLYFTERYQERLGASLPEAEDARRVPITYNLAYAMADTATEVHRAGLLKYLIQRAAILEPITDAEDSAWDRLIAADEWKLFPRDELFDLIFSSPESLNPGAEELQREAVAAAERLGLDTESYLATWWDARDRDKRQRLEALAQETGLIPHETGLRLLTEAATLDRETEQKQTEDAARKVREQERQTEQRQARVLHIATLLQAARRALERQEFEQALQHLNSAHDLDPQHPDIEPLRQDATAGLRRRKKERQQTTVARPTAPRKDLPSATLQRPRPAVDRQRHSLLWAVAIAVALIAATWTYHNWQPSEPVAKSPPDPPPSTVESNSPPSPSTPSAGVTRTEIDRVVDRLFVVLGESQRPSIKALYQSHFVVEPAPSRSRLGTENVAWGIAKLLAVRENKIRRPQDLMDPSRRSSLKLILKSQEMTFSTEDRIMMAFACCQAFGIVGFPRVTTDAIPHEVLLLEDQDCGSITADSAVPGLLQLIDFVRNP